jgi:hypothetical protein
MIRSELERRSTPSPIPFAAATSHGGDVVLALPKLGRQRLSIRVKEATLPTSSKVVFSPKCDLMSRRPFARLSFEDPPAPQLTRIEDGAVAETLP